MIHPRQMETFHPSNVEDDEIPTGITHVSEGSYSLPLTSPTSITYFLYRIQAATLVREVIDSLPPSFLASPGTEGNDELYENILALDQKFQQFLTSLPPFFQLTIPPHDSTDYQAFLREKPYLEWQRYLINFVIHTHRARLHRPFLIRGSMQLKYAYSRMQCIKSAETVIEIQKRTMSHQNIGAFTYVLQHFLMAAIILAMDVCFSPSNIRVSERKQEVLLACRELERELNAKTISSSGVENENVSTGQLMVKSFRKAVQSLRDILRKKINEGEPDGVAPLNAPGTQFSVSRDERRRIVPSPATHEAPSGRDHHMINPFSTTSNNTYPNEPIVHDGSYTDQSNEQQGPIAQPSTDAGRDQTGFDDAQPSGELMVDELWDEFFTVGSNFNDTDWDAFLLDVGDQMSRME